MSIEHNSNHLEIDARIKRLSNYLHESLDKRIIPNNSELIAFMKQEFPQYDRNKLFRDMKHIRSADNFVLELSIESYSWFIRDIFNKIEICEQEAMNDFNNNSGFVRINAKKLLLDCQKVKSDILSGNVINLSVEKLSKLLRALQDENKKLKEERILKSKVE